MIRKSVWHITSTELLARVAYAVGAAIAGSFGIHFSSRPASMVASLFVALLIYRVRYKRL